MSSQRIKDTALKLFTEKGYEGTSLADIAEVVGMKKSSIYNHYKSKDDLFLSIFETCSQGELTFYKRFFANDAMLPTLQLLKTFIDQKTSHFSQSTSSKFLFRFMIFPPFHMKQQLEQATTLHNEQSKQIIMDALHDAMIFRAMEPKRISEMISLYCVLLEGILVETLFGNQERSLARIEEAWAFYLYSVDVGNKVISIERHNAPQNMVR
ncbi:TetR/AcrR family transcriptional regulator [Solibacillus sp. FSL H8-0538]|uniref:TetR/AcrR family transcriptional regulator n=1 Tax=Solibacillus sp. FSL H8-0538 TaxID=2921400 RepID=UPI0030F9C103